MKKNKKGFTLIELLAVIVILAVIALIVTPIVTGIISKAKASADLRSAEGYVDAAKNFFSATLLDTNKAVKLGSNVIDDLDVSSKDATGSVVVDKTGLISMAIVINNKCYSRNTSSNDITVSDDIDNCNIVLPTPDECFETEPSYQYTFKFDDPEAVSYCTSYIAKLSISQDDANKLCTGGTISNGETSYNFQTIMLFSSEELFPELFSDEAHNFITRGENILGITDYLCGFDDDELEKQKYLDVVIPSSINGEKVTFIQNYAFVSKKLKSLVIPNTVNYIGMFSFKDNELNNVSIPSSVNYISFGAFNVNQLPDDKAFIYARNQDGSEDKTKVVSYAGAKKDNVIIPSGVKSLFPYSMYGNSITSLTLPDGLESIGMGSLSTNKFTNINIPDSVTTVDDYAFCKDPLGDMTLPSTVTNASSKAFNCEHE